METRIASVYKAFEKDFEADIYNVWIKNIKFVSANDLEVVLSCPNAFTKDWINREYLNGSFKLVNGEKKWLKKGIKDIVLEYFPKLMSLDLVVDKNFNKDFAEKAINEEAHKAEEEHKIVSFSENDNLYNIGTDLNKNYTFDNFVVGDSNRIAYEVAKSVADNDINSDYNPLFLYGSVGIGKTHLCQSIAWRMRENFKNKRIIYLSAEKFMYLFVQALQKQDVNTFKNNFRNVDCLIIDDIQFIVGKDNTQKEFFYTFETLANDGKQIVLACDKAPVNLELDEKLKSRLNGGMIIDIKDNDFNLRYEIFKKKCSEYKLNLSDDLLKFLANSIVTNTREMEGCLKRLQVNEHVMKIKTTRQVIENILSDNIIKSQKTASIETIQKKVADYFSININDLKSEKRLKELVLPRHIAMYLAKTLTNKSYPDVAKKFSGKNHATVIHAVKKIESEMKTNFEINEIITNLTNKIK